MKRVRKIMFLAAFAAIAFLGATCPQRQTMDPDKARERDADAIYVNAENLYHSGDVVGSKPLYQQVAADYPETKAAQHSRFRLGQITLKEGDSDAALKIFTEYADTYRDESELALAQDYAIKILQNQLAETKSTLSRKVSALEDDNYRLKTFNEYLQKSIDSETLYIEIDIENDRLLVKMGTQTLYVFPIVTGKGETWFRDWNTPTGVRQVESVEKDPKWYRPDWVWKEKGLEVPEDITMEERAVPGALGPYKVSIGDGYFIHGTSRGKIKPGKFSHGCIRMNNNELKELVKMVDVGTMVYLH